MGRTSPGGQGARSANAGTVAQMGYRARDRPGALGVAHQAGWMDPRRLRWASSLRQSAADFGRNPVAELGHRSRRRDSPRQLTHSRRRLYSGRLGRRARLWRRAQSELRVLAELRYRPWDRVAPGNDAGEPRGIHAGRLGRRASFRVGARRRVQRLVAAPRYRARHRQLERCPGWSTRWMGGRWLGQAPFVWKCTMTALRGYRPAVS